MKKNIVHVHQKFYPYKGGSTQRLLNQLININKSEFNIFVISQKIGDEPYTEVYRDINIIRYKKFSEIPTILSNIDKSNKIDIIHAHNFRPALYSRLINLKLRKKFIIEMHSVYETTSKFKDIIGDLLLKYCDKIIVLSKKSKYLLREKECVDESKIELLYNGIDIKKYKNYINNEVNIEKDVYDFINKNKNEGKIIAGYIGSLREFQGIDNLIKIINSVTNDKIAFIVIGGTKEENDNIKACIQHKNTYIREFIDNKNVNYVYTNMDILLMPRPKIKATESAVPLKPIEALMSGTLIYSTDVGGMVELKEVTKSNKIIFLDVEKMINKLNIITKDDLIIEENSNIDIEQFDIQNQVLILEKIYKEML